MLGEWAEENCVHVGLIMMNSIYIAMYITLCVRNYSKLIIYSTFNLHNHSVKYKYYDHPPYT